MMMNLACSAARLTLSALLALALAGCAASPSADATTDPADAPAHLTPVEVTMFDGRSGEIVSLEHAVGRAADADVIILGEMHGHPAGLDRAAAVFEGVLAQRPDAALALEFFERDHQPAIDDYLLGLTNAEQFRLATARTAGNYPPGHERMLEAARLAGAPVYAANAPRRYVRLARMKGYPAVEALTWEQRRLLAIPWRMPSGRYRDEFISLMSAMAGDPAAGKAPGPGMAPEDFFRSQSMWDATMASTVARALDAGHSPVVLVVGKFHSDFEGGTVQLLRDLAPEARIITFTIEPDAGSTLAPDDRNRADFILYAGPMPEQN